MVKRVNACGLTCPAPVLLVKDAVEEGGHEEIAVLVDNAASSENVSRFLTYSGYGVKVSSEDDIYTISAILDKDKTPPEAALSKEPQQQGSLKILVMITTERLGSGDDVLGAKLMTNYIKTLKEFGSDLWQLIFINGGVKLTINSSPVLTELQDYEQAGTTVLACGTCLEHFGVTAEKGVGSATNMLDIVSATHLADKVITIG